MPVARRASKILIVATGTRLSLAELRAFVAAKTVWNLQAAFASRGDGLSSTILCGGASRQGAAVSAKNHKRA